MDRKHSDGKQRHIAENRQTNQEGKKEKHRKKKERRNEDRRTGKQVDRNHVDGKHRQTQSDRNLACAILIRHKRLSDGEVCPFP